jgi:methylated-DNA-[protein]-cysteine S-methyltransferase
MRANPIPIVVACHRVTAHDGSLGGYSGGLDVKRRLHAHEGVAPLRGGWTSSARKRNGAG